MTALEEFLLATPFFGGLQPGQLALLSQRLKTREVMPGEQVFREGEQGQSMYVVEVGELCAWQAADGRAGNRITEIADADDDVTQIRPDGVRRPR